MNTGTEKIIRAALRADETIPGEQIPKAIAILRGQNSKLADALPLMVSQARVCELLSCSRFHVRKLVREGLLPQRDIAGLIRYSVADVMRLAGGVE